MSGDKPSQADLAVKRAAHRAHRFALQDSTLHGESQVHGRLVRDTDIPRALTEPGQRSLDWKKSATLEQLLEAATYGPADPDALTTLRSRLLRLKRSLDPVEVAALEELAGSPIRTIAAGLLAATDPDSGADVVSACKPLAANPLSGEGTICLRRLAPFTDALSS